MENQNPLTAKTQLLTAIIAGLISGGLYATQGLSPALGSILGIFAGVPLFVAGLGFGTVTVALSALIGTIGCFAMAPDIKVYGMYIIMHALPVTFLVAMALRKRMNVFYPTGRIIAWLAGYIVLLFVGTDIVLSMTKDVNLQQYIHDMLMTQLDAIIAQNQAVYNELPADSAQMATDQISQLMTTMGNIYPGTFMISALLAIAGNAVIAMHLLKNSVRLHVIRTSFDFNNLSLPHWVAVLAVVTAGVSMFLQGHVGFIVANLSLLFFAVEMMEGLAVIHAHAATKDEKGKKRLLWLVYMSIAAFFVPIFAVAVIGIIDHIKDFRKLRT